MSTFVRIQEQTASALLGVHVQVGAPIVDQRIQTYAEAVYPRSSGPSEAYSRALDLLSSAVRKQADVLSYIDGFAVVAIATCAAFVVIAILRDPPADHPALPRRRV